jgi:hypothetical protein
MGNTLTAKCGRWRFAFSQSSRIVCVFLFSRLHDFWLYNYLPLINLHTYSINNQTVLRENLDTSRYIIYLKIILHLKVLLCYETWWVEEKRSNSHKELKFYSCVLNWDIRKFKNSGTIFFEGITSREWTENMHNTSTIRQTS